MASSSATLSSMKPTLQQLNPEQQKEIIQQRENSSPFPEITKALIAGDFTKFSPWLREHGWAPKEIKGLADSHKIAKMFRPTTAAYAIHSELLKQAVKKENLDVFKAVPMTFLDDIRDLAEFLSFFREAMRRSPENQVYKDMEAVLKTAVLQDQYLLCTNSRPLYGFYKV